MKIAVDAMGGDYAPKAPVEGALLALREYDFEIVLVGVCSVIEPLLQGKDYPRERLSIVDCPEVIGMHESPAISVRKKRNSSIVKAVELVETKQADAMLSAGNTGAVVCAATLSLRLLRGVERPGIAIIFPTLKEPVVVIDVGANIDPKPMHIFQYAVMAEAYSRYILKKQNPKVALLNIGEEETKGTSFSKDCFTLLEKSALNFAGNIEGRDIFRGEYDVVVCDGFVGNIILKLAEGVAEAFIRFIKEIFLSNFISKVGALLVKPAFQKFHRKIDYAEYGGAPLLGVNGTCIICHGVSSPKAIKNAIRFAGQSVSDDLNLHIVESLNLNNQKL